MIYYAYTEKKKKKARIYTFLGSVKVKESGDNDRDGRRAMKRAKKKWPEARWIDLKFKHLVADKKKGTIKKDKAPWVGKKNWQKVQAKYYAKKYAKEIAEARANIKRRKRKKKRK